MEILLKEVVEGRVTCDHKTKGPWLDLKIVPVRSHLLITIAIFTCKARRDVHIIGTISLGGIV